MGAYSYSSFTNFTNLLAFAVRGSAENVYCFFAALPLMLPGVNANSTLALSPILNQHMEACGFGKGESTAWVNNLRAMTSVIASLLYGYYYSWCSRNGVYAGSTFALIGLLGGGLPQLLMMLVSKDTLEPPKTK